MMTSIHRHTAVRLSFARLSSLARPFARRAVTHIGRQEATQARACFLQCHGVSLGLLPRPPQHRRAQRGVRGAKVSPLPSTSGAEVEAWPSCAIASKAAAGKDRCRFVLEVGEELRGGYAMPGQFVQVRVSGAPDEAKPCYIALANEVGAECFEIVVKRTDKGTMADLICDATEGEALELSPVMGKGFQLEDKAPAEVAPKVLLFATGTGIAPIRALIKSGALKARGDVRLYYGFKDAEHAAYEQEFAQWKAQGVTVVPVQSDPYEADIFAIEGEVGYVQDAFAKDLKAYGADGLLGDKRGVVAVCAGYPEVAEVVGELFQQSGVPEGRVLLNF